MPKNNSSEKDLFLATNIKALLQEKLWLLEDRLNQMRNLSAYAALSNAEVRILSALQGQELTISEVARRLGISRQAAHKTISNLVARDLLQLKTTEENLRDKSISFTPTGEKMKKEAGKILKKLEQDIQTAIGDQNFRKLKSLLTEEW